MTEVRLKATDLLTRNGFSDGNLLDDILEDAGYDTLAAVFGDDAHDRHSFGRAVLCECVRRYLAPMIPLLPIGYDISMAHNPVRLKDWDRISGPKAEAALEPASVVLNAEDVLRIADELSPGYPTAFQASATAP